MTSNEFPERPKRDHMNSIVSFYVDGIGEEHTLTPNEIIQEIYEMIDWHEQLGLARRACCLRFVHRVLFKTQYLIHIREMEDL